MIGVPQISSQAKDNPLLYEALKRICELVPSSGDIAGYFDANVPIGTIVMYGGLTAPAGWLFCDGSEVSRTKEARLYSAIGVTYGKGDGVLTFNLPNMAGSFPIGPTVGVLTGQTGQVFGAGASDPPYLAVNFIIRA